MPENGRPSFAVDFTGTRFLETSRTKAQANRLNWRCELMLNRHIDAVKDRRVLDLASHDGRFTWACLKLGARHVTGIEARDSLVSHARETLGALGYGDRCTFVQGDIFDVWSRFGAGQFDTVLCLGFFYHTIRQVELFQQVRALGAKYLVLDTMVRQPPYDRVRDLLKSVGLGRLIPTHMASEAFLEFKREDHRVESNTIAETGIVAVPTERLIELLYENFGYAWRKVRWADDEVTDWEFLGDYKRRRRASYVGELR